MSTARKYSESNQGPIQQKIHHVMDQLETLLTTLSKNKDCPTLQQGIDQCAKDIISISTKHHKEIAKYESFLKNAIIDLTEVPHMQPQMQRIAFEVAITAALTNLQSFLDSNS
jgi:hypothetical protein